MKITQYSLKHCPVCKEMKPELRKLKRAGYSVNVIDCEKETSKCKGIQAAPTLILKKGGKSRKIVGFATADEIKRKFDSL